jgi:hypothetical protein
MHPALPSKLGPALPSTTSLPDPPSLPHSPHPPPYTPAHRRDSRLARCEDGL